MGRWAAACGLAGVLAVGPVPAQAQRIVEIRADGECPTEGELRAAMEERFGAIATDGEGWRMATAPDPSGTGTRFVLHAPDGSLALERRVASADCAALAMAFAIMADAFFVDLGVRTAPEPVVVQPPVRPPVRPPRPPLTPVRPPEGRPASFSLGLAGGGDFGLMPTVVTGFGTFEGGFRPADFPIAFRLALGGSAGVELPEIREDQRVERWALSARLAAALRLLRAPMIVDVSAGPALLVARVTALDLPARPSQSRYHGGLAVALAGGVPLGNELSLRAEVAATIWPPGETYRIDPGGMAVAESPLMSLTAGAGVQWETNR